MDMIPQDIVPTTRDPEEPVFIVGAARSGTTLLGNCILASDHRLGYTGEINFVWRYGMAFSRTELRTTAKQHEIDYIRKWFQSFAKKTNKKIILDKTPSNCLRVPMLAEVFPNAKVIHLVRDGRAVAFSSAQEWCGIGRDALDSKEFRGAKKQHQLSNVTVRKGRLSERVRDTRSLFELAADLPKAYRTYARILSPGKPRVWGPIIPGLKEMAKRLPLLETCALQWDFCSRVAHYEGTSLGEGQYLFIRYEDLLNEPWVTLHRIYDFLGLSLDDSIVGKLSQIEGRIDRWRKFADEKDVTRLSEILAPTLKEFGYTV